ncbi:MAG: hypothetical protein KA175_09485 [Flavobacteriales bacterium]|nr:hypothetical protein [Flavobacteriales bacterium]MBP6697839.1 hypothetical protein [Flavobacteriales bacterium]
MDHKLAALWRVACAVNGMTRSERHALRATALLPIIMAAVWFQAPLWSALLLLTLVPVVVIQLVWSVLHDTTSPTAELPPGHEWDYQDRPDLARRT